MKMALISEEQIKQIEDALTFLIMASGGETGCDHQYKICFCKEQAAFAIIQSLKPQEPVAWMYHDGSSPEAIPSDLMGTVFISFKQIVGQKNELPLYTLGDADE